MCVEELSNKGMIRKAYRNSAWYKRTYFRNTDRLTDIENKLVTKGIVVEVGRDKLGGWG